MNQLLNSLTKSQLRLTLQISKPAFLDFFNREVSAKLATESELEYKDIKLKVLKFRLEQLSWSGKRWDFSINITFIPSIKAKALADSKGIDLSMNGRFRFFPGADKKILFNIDTYSWARPPSIKIFGFKFSQERLVNFVINQTKDRLTEQVNTIMNKNASKYFSAEFLRPIMATQFELEAKEYFANIDGQSLQISEFVEENQRLKWTLLAHGNAYLDDKKDNKRFWNSWTGLDWLSTHELKPNQMKLAGAMSLSTIQKLLNNSLTPIDIPALGRMSFAISELKAEGRNIELRLKTTRASLGELQVNGHLDISDNDALILKLDDLSPVSKGRVKMMAWDLIKPVLIKRIETNLRFTKADILNHINTQIKAWDSTLRKQIKMNNEIALLDCTINQLEAEDQRILFDLDVSHRVNLEITSFY